MSIKDSKYLCFTLFDRYHKKYKSNFNKSSRTKDSTFHKSYDNTLGISNCLCK